MNCPQITNWQQAIEAQLGVERFLLSHGLRDLVGDYGEFLAHQAIGGRLMPPVTKHYDIEHPNYGLVQVKTRRLGERVGGRKCCETRAVFKSGYAFDTLFHIILGEKFEVLHAATAPRSEVEPVARSKSNKIPIETTKALSGGICRRGALQQVEAQLFKQT